jgi:uncharacterized membrane protein
MKFDYKKILNRYEYLFLIIGLIFGLVLITANPPFHSNDEDRHFLHAYAISEGDIYPQKGESYNGSELPVNLIRMISKFQGIPYHRGARLRDEDMEKFKKIKLERTNSDFYPNPLLRDNPLPFALHALFIKICPYQNPILKLYFARFGGLVLYLFLIFMAIKLSPVFKPFLFLFALTPMILFQATSVTYDTMSTGLSFLIFALVLRYSQSSRKMTLVDLQAVILVLLLHRFAKDGYVFFPLLFLIIPKSNFSSVKKAFIFYFFILAYGIFLYYLPNLSWYNHINSLDLHPFQPLKKDFIHSFPMNLDIFLSDLGNGIGNIFSSTLFHRQDWFSGIIGRFGYSYKTLPQFLIILHGLVLILLAFFSPEKRPEFKSWQKFIMIMVGFLSIAAIIVGFYLNSPVGAKNIFGLQGRYFIPAIPLIFFALYNQKFRNTKWEDSSKLILSIYSVLVLLYTVNFIYDEFYI